MATFLDTVTSGVMGLQGLKSNQLQLDAAKQKQADLQEASTALQDYYKTGNQQSLINATLKSPQLAGQMLTSLGLDDERKQKQAATDVAELWQLRSNPEAFKQKGLQRIDAIMQRGGNPTDTINLLMAYDKDPKQAEMMLQSVGAGLEASGFKTGIFSGQAEPMSAYQQASTDLRKQELEFNKQQKQMDLQLKVLESQMKREDNDLKKQELALKIEDQKQKIADAAKQRETMTREKDTELKQANFSMDNMLNTVERIKKSPKLDSVIGTVQGRMDAYVDDEAAATIRLIEGLGSQAFMAMIPSIKGMGALSNAEGDKLAASLQNLSRVTSEEAFKENLNEVERLIKKSRSFMAEKYGKEQAAPDTPAAPQADNVIDWGSMN